MKTAKVYELFYTGNRLSTKTIDNNGQIVAVVATSVKQAIYFAHSNVWATDVENPLGIIWTYNKWLEGQEHNFLDGKGYCQDGEYIPQHGDGKRIITKWMKGMEKTQ